MHIGVGGNPKLLADRLTSAANDIAHRDELCAVNLLVAQQLRVSLGDATATNEGEPELSHDAEGNRSNHGARLIPPGTGNPLSIRPL
jgi:hypothetical protein